MNRIFGNVWFGTKWWHDEFGILSKNPFEETMEEQLEASSKHSRLLYSRFGHLGYGSLHPDPVYQVPQHDGRILTASAYGGKKPGWDTRTA